MKIMKEEGAYTPQQFEDEIYKNWEEKGYFRAKVNKNKKPFTIVMPPPNVTSKAHVGRYSYNIHRDICHPKKTVNRIDRAICRR